MKPDVDQTLREWKFQGGPPRMDRWAALRPMAYAVLFASLMGSLFLPLLWLAWHADTRWMLWLSLTLLIIGAAAGFLAGRRNGRYLGRVLARWEEQHGEPS